MSIEDHARLIRIELKNFFKDAEVLEALLLPCELDLAVCFHVVVLECVN